MCYARYKGPERAAAWAAEARVAAPQPLTADEARAAAAAEGLELVPSSSNETGFRGVFNTRGKYFSSISEKGKVRYFPCCATPEEAALCLARYLGAKRAATVAPEARGRGQQPLTADDARAAAAAEAEGLELVPSSGNVTGFKGVYKSKRKYGVMIRENGKEHHLGRFATPVEAALCYARYIGPERAAAWAVEARVAAPQPLTADEARAAAAAEGLELVPSSRSQTDFKGVTKVGGRYAASSTKASLRV